MAKGTIIVNRGTRTYNLLNGPNGESRSIPPGGSIEVLDDKEAAHLLRYNDLQDMAKASPQTAAKIKAHEAEIARLTAENERLQKQQKAAAGAEDDERGAGTGFAGGPPNLPGSKAPDLDTDPTHREVDSLTEAQEDAEKAEHKSSSKVNKRR